MPGRDAHGQGRRTPGGRHGRLQVGTTQAFGVLVRVHPVLCVDASIYIYTYPIPFCSFFFVFWYGRRKPLMSLPSSLGTPDRPLRVNPV